MTPRLIYVPVTVATLLIVRYFLRKREKPLPPGPRGRFLTGNLPDFPRTDAEKADTFVKWREDYGAYHLIFSDHCFSEHLTGSVMHLDVFGKHTIVLNSVQATRDLMDKRAAIYSDRPRMVMLVEL